jgi:ribosome-binding factor A
MRHYLTEKEQVRDLCAELGEDDGQAPRLKTGRKARGRRARTQDRRIERKASQLCRQVAVTLDEVFADCGDGVLQGLHVVSAAPFPDASRLLVTVSSIHGTPGTTAGPEVVLDHLNRASGHLRFEIAASVTRKRAPLLLYRLAGPWLAEVDYENVSGASPPA